VIKRILQIALVVAIVATPINDVGRYLGGYYNLDNATRDIASQAGMRAKNPSSSRDQVAAFAAQFAQQKGITVKYFDQTVDKVTVWTTTTVPGTWVWGPAVAASQGVPFPKWWSTPLVIESKAESLIM
jgi:hypothetical protein